MENEINIKKEEIDLVFNYCKNLICMLDKKEFSEELNYKNIKKFMNDNKNLYSIEKGNITFVDFIIDILDENIRYS